MKAEPTTGTYQEPAESSPRAYIPFLGMGMEGQ